jgi:hypothetical protein
LDVLSEPPGLDVTLDNTLIGKTPIFIKNVKSGAYQLRIKVTETTIYVEPGATLQISLFKGEFINIPVTEQAPERQPAIKEKKINESRINQQVSKEEQRNKLNSWDRYIDGSSNHF